MTAYSHGFDSIWDLYSWSDENSAGKSRHPESCTSAHKEAVAAGPVAPSMGWLLLPYTGGHAHHLSILFKHAHPSFQSYVFKKMESRPVSQLVYLFQILKFFQHLWSCSTKFALTILLYVFTWWPLEKLF